MSPTGASTGDESRLLLRSSSAALAAQIARVVITLGVQFLLRRFVPVDEYGIYDWSVGVIILLGALRDLGLQGHVLRRPERPFGNLLQGQLVWGGVLSLATFVAAPWLAGLMREADPALVVPILRVLALAIFLEGLGQVPLMYFEGELRVERALAPEIVRHLVFTLGSTLLAFLGWGAWSLALGWVASIGVQSIWLWIRAWGEIELRFLPGQTLTLYRESLALGSFHILAILNLQVDAFVLGLRVDPFHVGLYTFAYFFVIKIGGMVVHSLGRVAFSAFVRYRDRPERSWDVFRLATLLVMAIEVPIAWGLFLNAPLAIDLVGDRDNWPGSAELLRILCWVPLLDPLGRFAAQLFGAWHRERLWIVASSTTLASVLGLGLFWTGLWGVEGMAWARFAPLGVVVTIWGLARLPGSQVGTTLRQLGLVYAIPVPFFLLAAQLGPLGSWTRLSTSLVAAGLGLLATAAALRREWTAFRTL